MMKLRWGLLLLVFLLVGCGSAERRPAPVEDEGLSYRPEMDERRGTPVRLASTSPQRSSVQRKKTGSAAMSLLSTAERQERAGQLTTAAATLERALRIEPRNPVLLSRLARVRFSQGQHQRAISFASKSNGLAGGNYILKRNNWSLIAKAKRAMGDEFGAQQAGRRAAAAGR